MGRGVSEFGQVEVDCIKLDDRISSSGAYIKIDVEEYEEQVLLGMKNAIQKYKLQLSVSLYHRPGDFWKLCNMIMKWNTEYKLILRHYQDNYADTRCYFWQ